MRRDGGATNGINEMNRPPLGLRPRRFVDEERLSEVYAAIARYLEAGKPVPVEWIEEYNELAVRLDASG